MKLLRDASWIAHPGSLEPEIRTAFTLVLDLLKPAVFWDIGANVGFYSWFVRQHRAVRQVIMFEPDPTNFALIESTIRKNGISDCRAMNVALADQAGDASFLVDRVSGAAGSLEATSHRDNTQSLHHLYRMSETITCRKATIDGLIAEGVPPPNLMKIDVERAEHLVLAGAKVCLTQQLPTIIIETHNRELIQQLKDTGYSVFRIDAGNLLFIPTITEVDLTPFRRAFSQCD